MTRDLSLLRCHYCNRRAIKVARCAATPKVGELAVCFAHLHCVERDGRNL